MGRKHEALTGAGAAVLLLFAVSWHQEGTPPVPPGPVPIGTVVAFTGEQVPEGWLLCDGRSLQRQDWPELYRTIGGSHGAGVSPLGVKEGDFNLPDYRGRFLRGLDLSDAGERLNSDPTAHMRFPARAGTGNGGNRVGSYQPDATALPRDPLEPFRTVVRIPTVGRAIHAGRTGAGEPPPAETVLVLASQELSRKHLVTGGDAETRPKNVTVRWIIRAKP